MLLLDLFCGAGGAGVGYNLAGYDVIGVDIENQPDYPYEFYKADAIDVLNDLSQGKTVFGVDPGEVAVVHTSPPCQAHTDLTRGTNKGREYIDLVPDTRALLAKWREWRPELVTIIENTPQRDVLRDDVILCGEMFGLGVIRHRFFELSHPVGQPEHIKHRGRVRGWRHGEYFDGPYLAVYGRGGYKGTVAEWQEAMNMHWTNNRKSIAEAIPPDYTEWLGGAIKEEILDAAEI